MMLITMGCGEKPVRLSSRFPPRGLAAGGSQGQRYCSRPRDSRRDPSARRGAARARRVEQNGLTGTPHHRWSSSPPVLRIVRPPRCCRRPEIVAEDAPERVELLAGQLRALAEHEPRHRLGARILDRQHCSARVGRLAQSTMNSFAPTRVEERCGSISSASW